MAKRYEITNLSNRVQTFEGNIIQPRTRRVLNLDERYEPQNIERWRSRGVHFVETSKEPENGRPLPPADPQLVDAYNRLTTAEGADREAVLAELGLAPGKSQPAAVAPKKADT